MTSASFQATAAISILYPLVKISLD